MNKLIDNKSIDSMRRIINCAVIFSLFLIVLFTCPAWAATYYVKNGGNDSLDGLSDSTAWATVSRVASTVRSGDTVYFRSQDTWGGTSLPILTTTAGVTYNGSAYGSGTRATIKPTSGSGYGAVNIFASNVTFKGFNIDLNGLYAGGINIGMTAGADLTNITVDDCLVHDSALTESTPHYYYGIYVGAYGVHTTSNVQILNSKVYRMGHEGIVVYPSWMQKPSLNHASNILIRGNEVYDVGNAGDYRGNAIDFGLDSDNVIVEFNYVHDFHENGIVAVSGGGEYAGLGGPNNAIVRYNIVSKTPFNKAGVAISTADGGDGAFYGNILIDSDFFIGRINLNSGSWKLYNNTSYHSASSSRPGLYLYGPTNTTGLEFKNNIIYYAGSQYPIEDVAGSLTNHSDNLIYRASGTLVHVGSTSYTAANVATWENTAVTANPAFTGGTLPTGFTGTYGKNMVPNTTYFALGSASPAINAGVTLGSSYNGCINGAGLATPITRPQGAAYDIGAYEYAESGGVVPPPVVTPPVVTPPVVTPPAAPKNLRVVE